MVLLQVESFAAGLIALGLKKGDHVGIWAPNNIEWFVSIMAIIKAGLIAVSSTILFFSSSRFRQHSVRGYRVTDGWLSSNNW
jgi:acyl-CoA synthetase (AMP-forming)/AMP-acid ligase II